MPSRFRFYRPVIRSFHHTIGKSALILPSAFLVAIALGCLSLGMVFFVRDVFSAGAALIGWFAAFWAICYFAGCMFLRPALRRVLPRYSLMIATGLSGLFNLGMLVWPSLVVSFILYGLLGLSMSLFWPPLMGWLSHGAEGRQLNKMMSRFNLAWSSGAIVSPLLAGYLSELRPDLPVLASTIVFFASFAFIAVLSIYLPRIRHDTYTDRKKRHDRDQEDRSTDLRFPAWVGVTASYITLGVMSAVFPLFAREQLGISESGVGTLFLVRSLFATLGFIILGRTAFWHFKPGQMIVGQVCYAVLWVGIARAGSFGLLMAVMLPLGLLMALVYNNSIFHGVSGSTQRAHRMAVHESILTAGSVLGSVIGGFLYQYHSMQTVFALCVVTLLAGGLVQVLTIVIGRRRASAREDRVEDAG